MSRPVFPSEAGPVSDMAVVSELRAVAVAIHMVGLENLPTALVRTPPTTTCIEHQAGRPTQRLSFQIKVF